jgi:Tol biopolymer transport system component
MSIARRLITLVALAGAVLMNACRDTPAPQTPVLRLTLAQLDELVSTTVHGYTFGLALAPDGRRLALAASDAGDAASGALWLRDLAVDRVTPLPNTTDAELPFWSPDGSSLAFFASGKLRAINVGDGGVHDLADAPAPAGGAWHPSGEIIFAPRADGGLMRRTAEGAIEPFTTLAAGESSHRLPQVLDDDHVIFYVRSSTPTRQGVWIARRDQPAARKRLASSDAAGIPLGGAVVYASGDALVVQRVNREAMALEGRPQLVGSPVGRNAEHELHATAGGEVLVFGVSPSVLRELRWIDRAGADVGLVGEPMNANEVRVSPDGTRVAVARVDPQLRTMDVWVYEGNRPLPRRLSPAIDVDDSPVWSRDGSRIAWITGRRTVTTRDARAATPEVSLHKFDNSVRATDWSPDGRWIVVTESTAASGTDITLLSASSSAAASPTRSGAVTAPDDGRRRAYASAPFNESFGTVSPDGRWLAYASDESGDSDIYVDTFPAPRKRARISVGGGTEPRWSRDGRSLYFRRGAEIHVAALTFATGAPEAAASQRLVVMDAELRAFDVAPDDQRFLVNVPAAGGTTRPYTVIVHALSLLPSAP